MSRWLKALFIGLVLGAVAFIIIRAVVQPDPWEQSCLDRGGRVDSMHITFEGGQMEAQDWQVCVVNEQPQETRQI
jgi:hypothetical protein